MILDFDDLNRLGRIYTSHGSTMAHNLRLFESCRDTKSETMRKARTWAAWSIHAWQAMISYYSHQPPEVTELPEDPLSDDPDWYEEIYLRYPPSETPHRLCFCSCVKAKCQLRSIKGAFGSVSVNDKALLTSGQVASFCS